MALTVDASQALAGLTRTNFVNTWSEQSARIQKDLGEVMHLGIKSTLRTETYHFFDDSDDPERVESGEPIPETPFKGVSYQVANHEYKKRVPFLEIDVEDDQTGNLESRARETAKKFARLSQRIRYQIITGTVNLKLLPFIPTAPDGAVMYSATAGGLDRFQVSGGNIVGKSGTTPDLLRTDAFKAVNQILQFLEPTSGEPYWDESIQDDGIWIDYPSTLRKEFFEAFDQERTLQGGAATTNVFKDKSLPVKLRSSTKLTGTDWYVTLMGAEIKPIFQQVKRGIRAFNNNRSNSDRARNNGIFAVDFDQRMGYGLNEVNQTCKVA